MANRHIFTEQLAIPSSYQAESTIADLQKEPLKATIIVTSQKHTENKTFIYYYWPIAGELFCTWNLGYDGLRDMSGGNKVYTDRYLNIFASFKASLQLPIPLVLFQFLSPPHVPQKLIITLIYFSIFYQLCKSQSALSGPISTDRIIREP